MTLGASSPQAEDSGQRARIKVDVLREIGDVNPNLYGVFMKPIRSSMDGLLYDPDHPLANQDGRYAFAPHSFTQIRVRME